MTIPILRICFLSTCPNILSNDTNLRLFKAYIATRRNTTAATPFRSRQRRTQSATVLATSYRAKRRGRVSITTFKPDLLPYIFSTTCKPELFQYISQTLALSKARTRKPSPRLHPDPKPVVKRPTTPVVIPLTMEMPPLQQPRPASGLGLDIDPECPPSAAAESIPRGLQSPHRIQPSVGLDDLMETRSARSNSAASRNLNRLSLTLPIPVNLPTSTPTRPASTIAPSYPATPADTPDLMSPVDPRDFIAAIAAQERRVLDLREELARAERELNVLKRNFTHNERTKKARENRTSQRMRDTSMTLIDISTSDEDTAAAKRSAELERRKAILLGLQSAPGTPQPPQESRKKVFQGGHMRTLSLLSPTKTDPGDFSVHEDTVDQLKTSSKELDEQFANIVRYAPITPAQLSKRASWAPRTVHSQAASGVKQIAEDLKIGLWTFVEDLRQATVGDEPITGVGQPIRGSNGGARPANGSSAGDQETIRASVQPTRPQIATAFEDNRFGSPLQEESGNANRHQRKTSKAEKPKRWSWTPLTVDCLDDSDWSNWDMPPTKSPRWSGTTIAGDAIPTIPEKTDESETKDRDDQVLQPAAKLEELSWPVLNRLTPGKLKQQASEYIKEWEKSLTPPGSVTSEDDGINVA
ncbi:hypothetical protein MAPG_05813 [Magnaporthiopsis poae ATCC 64411]|uniref:DUF4048 domain-containing protein n=1 Tax=Magnaporthiopsis poae (strain ATCC 64411 / 73-15) TaxID=644358 RepID=A0A0C4E0E0_MAGP6|nr:hypothetical protein MAPG_05813 [Magnaporthiopsis poae ATCC 64411]